MAGSESLTEKISLPKWQVTSSSSCPAVPCMILRVKHLLAVSNPRPFFLLVSFLLAASFLGICIPSDATCEYLGVLIKKKEESKCLSMAFSFTVLPSSKKICNYG